jgi:hypothetical protein
MEDYLDEDPVLKNQQFVCLSFFIPGKEVDETNQDKQDSRCGLKIRGCYATMEQAEARVKELKSIDKLHHIYIGEVGKWLPFDPSPEESGKEIYSDKELNELMKKYKDNREKCDEVHEERAAMMSTEAKKENKKNNNDITLLGVDGDDGGNDDNGGDGATMIETDDGDDGTISKETSLSAEPKVPIDTPSFTSVNDLINKKMEHLTTN